ncbi:UNVERIFIED_CONTAM: hypothetical protein FKN15_064230 [Acipenser sinensis]
MTTIRISGNLPPNIDCTKAPIAFGRRAVPKLNEELQNPELITRQRALMSLCDLVHDPEIALEAMRLANEIAKVKEPAYWGEWEPRPHANIPHGIR